MFMKKALVLCGGGSLGSYEAGAYKYLREIGEEYDIFVGTSIGALNGVMFALGLNDEVEQIWKRIKVDKVMRNGINIYSGFFRDLQLEDNSKILSIIKSYISNNGVDVTPFHNMAKEYIDPKKVLASPKTIGIVTCRYPSLKEVDVVLNEQREEDVLDYVFASSACYPIFPLHKVNGVKHIDGGYKNNLPIDFAFKLGAEDITAILLHAIPRMPQHPELMDLPFVKCIRPSHDTGAIMDFRSTAVNDNFLLGYLDAKKVFNGSYGHDFCFKKEGDWDTLSKRFSLLLAKESLYDFHKVQETLERQYLIPESALETFIGALELLGDWLGLNYLKEYEVDEFMAAILKETRHHSRTLKPKEYRKHHPAAFQILESHRKDFVAAAYWGDYEPLRKISRRSHEGYAVIAFFELMRELGLTHRKRTVSLTNEEQKENTEE